MSGPQRGSQARMEPNDAMIGIDAAANAVDSTAHSAAVDSAAVGINLHQLDDDSVCVFYEQLRTAAAMLRSNAFHSDSIRSTELVHEAFAKMLGRPDAVFDSERHLLNTASLVMKSLLIDRLRRRKLRAGATAEIARLQLVRDAHAVPGRPDAVVEFHEHLQLLEQRRPLAAEVFRYRFFFEMTQREIASIVARSVPTVHREIAFARAFLARQMG
jgi:RNA polymerase sigma factor (TIGR02999 family)